MTTPHDPTVAVAVARLEAMTGDLQEIKGTLRELITQVGKLAVIEADQRNSNAAIERAFKEIERMGKRFDDELVNVNRRIKTLEDAQPLQRQATDWVQKAVTMLLVAALGALISMVVIAPKAQPALPVGQVMQERRQ